MRSSFHYIYIYLLWLLVYNEMAAVSLKCFTFSTVKSCSKHNNSIIHNEWQIKSFANNQNTMAWNFSRKIIQNLLTSTFLFMIFWWMINQPADFVVVVAKNWNEKKLTMNRLQIYNFISYWNQCWHEYLLR